MSVTCSCHADAAQKLPSASSLSLFMPAAFRRWSQQLPKTTPPSFWGWASFSLFKFDVILYLGGRENAAWCEVGWMYSALLCDVTVRCKSEQLGEQEKFRSKPHQQSDLLVLCWSFFWVYSHFKHPIKCCQAPTPPRRMSPLKLIHTFVVTLCLTCRCDASVGGFSFSFIFTKTRSFDSYFVVFQSPSWGMAAPPPPTACIPSCTSTLAPLRSHRCGGLTVSSVAPLGPSWPCHATAAAWVRHILSQTKHMPKWKEVSRRRADGIREQGGNVSWSWRSPPPSSLMHIHTWRNDTTSFPCASLSLHSKLGVGITKMWRSFLVSWSSMSNCGIRSYLEGWRREMMIQNSSSRFWGRDSPGGDEMLHRRQKLSAEGIEIDS